MVEGKENMDNDLMLPQIEISCYFVMGLGIFANARVRMLELRPFQEGMIFFFGPLTLHNCTV